MPTRTRAKFQCQEELRKSWNVQAATYKFGAIHDPAVPGDEAFTKATPCGSLEMLVDNPAVKFELGKFYYLDLTPVEDEAADSAP